MKKLTKIFMMAVCAIALMTVTSCKDYNQDLYNDLNAKQADMNTTLTGLIKQQEDALNAAVKDLNAKIDKIQPSTCKCEEQWKKNEVEINSIKQQLADLNNKLAGKADASEITDLKTLITSLQQQIDDLRSKIGQGGGTCECSAKWEELKGTLAAIDTRIKNLDEAIEKKADKTTVDALAAQLQAVETQLKSDIQNLVTRIATVESQVFVINELITKLQNQITVIEGVIAKIDEAGGIEKVLNTIYENTRLIGELQGSIDAMNLRLDCMGTKIETINNTLVTINNKIVTIDDRISNINIQIGQLDGRIAANEAWIIQMKALYGESLDKFEGGLSWIEKMKQLYGDELEKLAGGSGWASKLEELREELKQYADQVLVQSKTYAETLVNNMTINVDSKISDLTDAYKLADQNLQNQIDAISTNITNLTNRVNVLESEMATLKNVVTNIQNRLNAQISGIIVQAVTSPFVVNENIALPVDIKSNIICAYWGTNENQVVYFPSSSKTKNLSSDEEILSDDEADAVDNYEYYGIGDELRGNTGGKIYLTINPSNVDFSGAGLKLVDSQNGESGFDLVNVKPSDTQLWFNGNPSRAANNGFYEADVMLKDNFDVAKYNVAPLKNAASTFKQYIDKKAGLSDVAIAVAAAAFKSVQMPQYAVQAPYSYVDENGATQTAFVHSEYNIAATALSPLTYNLADKVAPYTGKIAAKIGTIEKYLHISEKFDNVLNTIKSKMYFKFDDVDFSFTQTIVFKKIDFIDDQEVIKVTVQYDFPTKVDPATGTVTETGTKTTEVVIKGKDLDNFVGEVNKQIEALVASANDKLKDVSIKLKDAVNDALVKTENTINDKVQDVVDYLSKMVHKTDGLFNKLSDIVKTVQNKIQYAGTYLYPTMFFADVNKNLKRMSPTREMAGYVNAGTMILYPTSYTAEVLNPAYRKVVQVTKAINRSTGVNDDAEVKAANKFSIPSYNFLCQVIDGAKRQVPVTLKSGYDYEIAYSALDYKGYQVTKRYWIKVK